MGKNFQYYNVVQVSWKGTPGIIKFVSFYDWSWYFVLCQTQTMSSPWCTFQGRLQTLTLQTDQKVSALRVCSHAAHCISSAVSMTRFTFPVDNLLCRCLGILITVCLTLLFVFIIVPAVLGVSFGIRRLYMMTLLRIFEVSLASM